MEELCCLAVLSLQSEAQEGRGQHSAAQVHAAPEDAASRGPAGGGTGAGGGRICEMGLGLGGLLGDSRVLPSAAVLPGKPFRHCVGLCCWQKGSAHPEHCTACISSEVADVWRWLMLRGPLMRQCTLGCC